MSEPIRDVEPRSMGPDPSGMGEILSVTDVETEIDDSPPARDEGKCPAEKWITTPGIQDQIALRCWEDAGHPRPHRDKVHGVAWDDSPMTLPWPPHTAASIVRDLIDAGAAWVDPTLAGDENVGAITRLQAWDTAVAAAQYLPGVAREDDG